MKILLAAFAVFGAVLVYRLAGLQIKDHQLYLEEALAPEKVLFQPIPANRGCLLARGPGGKGHIELVANEPCFEVAVYYPVLDPDEWWINDQHRRLRKKFRDEAKNPKLQVPREELALLLRQEMEEFWKMLGRNSSLPAEELFGRRDHIVQAIQRRIANVRKREEEVDYPIFDQRIYYPVISDLDEHQALEFRGKLADTPWAVVRPSTRRVYRRAKEHTLCHLLGRTLRTPGSLSHTYIKIDDDYMPGELQGQDGLELLFDTKLHGARGWLKRDKEPVIETPPEDGEDITLTFDVELQDYVQKRIVDRLKDPVQKLPYATGGAAVVLDLAANQLLALVSVPTFDPTVYKDKPKYQALKDDLKYSPMFNRALDGRYHPGSIVKPVVGAWAVEHGKTTSLTTFDCQGRLFPNINAFRCWKPPPGHGPVNFVGSLAHSCDVYYYHVGELVTAEGMSNLYKNIGFGRRVPLAASDDFPAGLHNDNGWVPEQAWFIKEHGRGMSVGDARNLAIGQGDLSITPLQAAIMVGEIITGLYRTPKLYTTEPDGLAFPVDLSPNVRRLAREGMFQVINDPNATGYKFAYTNQCSLAAKTGSAQAQAQAIEWEMSWKDPDTGKLIKQTTTNTKNFYLSAPVPRKIINQRAITFFPTLRPEDQKDETGRTKSLAHAWFVGYAPANHPRIVTVVFIEYGLAGGSAAGPVFRDIMLKCRVLGYFE